MMLGVVLDTYAEEVRSVKQAEIRIRIIPGKSARQQMLSGFLFALLSVVIRAGAWGKADLFFIPL
jgi:hypothetical protein